MGLRRPAGSCEEHTAWRRAFQPGSCANLVAAFIKDPSMEDMRRLCTIPAWAICLRRGRLCGVAIFAGEGSCDFKGGTMASFAVATALFGPEIHFPQDFNTNFLMLVRWIHFVAGITWIGLLYFFNLVNVPLMKELDATTKGKVMPALMTRAMMWFRMSAALTVLAGLAYWGNIVAADALNGQLAGFAATSGTAMASFFVIWTIVWAVLYACLIPGKGIFDKGAFVGLVYAVVVAAAGWLFLSLNNHGWESNRLLAIGIGGGIGWVMLLNVWGVIWRIQKRLIQWTKENAEKGTPMPEKAKAMARQAFLVSRANAYLSVALLFFMGAASHYPVFGK
jgi:uncharacterized membrane protein